MFEHVGVSHFGAFFETCRDLLTADGVMLLHSIGRSEPPGDTSAWIQHYIFPGGYIPALSEVVPAHRAQRPLLTDIEILRLHYAKTLAAWRERFLAHREEVAGALRRALLPDVGVLPGGLGSVVPGRRADELPGPARPRTWKPCR